jgi:hypothetical protein
MISHKLSISNIQGLLGLSNDSQELIQTIIDGTTKVNQVNLRSSRFCLVNAPA